MTVERRLSEDELNEQLILSIKRELLAYVKDGVPRSKKIDDIKYILNQINSERQVKHASLNRYLRYLGMFPPQDRLPALKKAKEKLLP